MSRPTISVITPAHPQRLRNGMLMHAVQSVCKQSLLPDAHIIAVDHDGDGAARTRDRALRQAQTEWVAFLDSDDWFAPNHLELLVGWAQHEQADFVYSWFRVAQQFADGRTQVLEEDPVFPATHFLRPFNPDDPIETTVTTLVRTELAQSVGFAPLDRGEMNSGEDYGFLLGCLKQGAKVSHLVRKTWFWRHHQLAGGVPGNTSGLPTKGDATL